MPERGFTLIELMVALVIVGILAGLAWPSYTAWQQSDALKNGFRTTKSLLQEARSRSVQEGVYWGKVKAPNGTECDRLYFGVEAEPGTSGLDLIYFCNQDADPDAVDSGNEVFTLDSRRLGQHVAVGSSTNIGNNRIFFAKNGSVFKGAGSIELTAGDLSRQVTVGTGGRIREQ